MWKMVIIDDDRQIIRSMKKMPLWQEMGIEIAGESMNGKRGMELILQVQPDIVMTDIYMPEMNGLEMMERLRAHGYQGKFIVLSGYSDFHYARQALRLQVDDYLSKPVTVETIESVLKRVTEKLKEELEKQIELEQLQQKLLLYEPFFNTEWKKSVAIGSYNTKIKQSIPLIDPYHHWEGKHHAVLVIENVRTERASASTVTDWNLFRFAIHNIIEEILKEDWPDSDCIELHSYHTAIILHTDQQVTDSLREKVRRLGLRMIQCVSHFLKLKIHVGVGTFKAAWTEISHSTEEAFRALSCKQAPLGQDIGLYEFGNIVPKAEVPLAVSQKAVLNPIPYYQQLIQAISFGQAERARQVIHAFTAELQGKEREGALTPNVLQILSRQCWTILSYSLFEIGIRLDEICSDTELAKQMEWMTSPEQFKTWLLRITEEIFAYDDPGMNVKHKQAVQFIIRFIHEHYAEDITLADLADKVYISRSYLSHIFKKATGETFNSYLTRVRMEKAKRMILEGKYMIYEVAEKVGYKSLPYFSTLFKKYVGVNPGELK